MSPVEGRPHSLLISHSLLLWIEAQKFCSCGLVILGTCSLQTAKTVESGWGEKRNIRQLPLTGNLPTKMVLVNFPLPESPVH